MFDSPATSYSDTTPQVRAITDVISLIDPSDTPLVELLGGLDGAAGKFEFVEDQATKIEWLEDTLIPLTGVLNGSIATNTTALTVTDASNFQEGHVLYIDAEYVYVTAVNTSTEVLTVTRNYGGTQATHADSASIEIVTMARLEGDDSDDIAFTDRTAPYNYTQIFHQEVKASGTVRAIRQYGIMDEFMYQSEKAVPQQMRLVEKGLFHGQRKQGSATTPRAFGGFSTFITDNTISAGGAVTQADFENALEAAYNDGGYGPWIAPMDTANTQVVKNFYDSSSFLRVDRTERTVGMRIDRIETPFGEVDLVKDIWAPNARIEIIDPAHAGMLTLRPFMFEPLSKTGDSDKGELVGEFTLCVRQDKAHAAITAIS